MAGVIVATPGWALLGRGGQSTQGPGARWRLGVLFRPSSLSGGGRPKLLRSGSRLPHSDFVAVTSPALGDGLTAACGSVGLSAQICVTSDISKH